MWFAGAVGTVWRGGGICARTRQGVGVNRPGCFAEYLAIPMTNVWHHNARYRPGCIAAIFDPFGIAVHTALSFPVSGRGCANHGRGADRHYGGGGRAACGGAAYRDHGCQPVSARPGAQAGRDRGDRRADGFGCRRFKQRLGMKRRLRCRAWRCPATRRGFRDLLANMCHGGQDRDARHSRRGDCVSTGAA